MSPSISGKLEKALGFAVKAEFLSPSGAAAEKRL